MSDALTPCPFCGREPSTTERPDNIDGTEFFYAVACYCGGYSACAHKMAKRKTPELAKADAIAAWNRRALTGAQPAPAAPSDAQIRWHELKTDPDVFDAVASGAKTHEIRRDDRNFKVGDGLLLRRTKFTGAQMHMRPEACPLEYTGDECRRIVSHVLSGYGLEDGWVILSFAPAAPAAPSELHGDALLAFNQCRAVAHMARSLAEVHDARAAIVAQSKGAPIEVIGESTAEIMEWLGDTLSNMDAVAEDDAWLDPVFEAAHARWPIAAPAAQPADSAMEVLRELHEAVEEMKSASTALEGRKAWARIDAACDRARTLSAASNKEIDRGL